QLANIIPDEYLAIAASLKIDDNLLASIIPTSITATASGVISSIDMIKGGLNFPKSTVATISSVDDLYIKMSVNEQNAERLSKNDKVVFKTAATKDVKFTGTIEKIFPSARKTLVGTSQETVVDVSFIPDVVYTNLKPGYTVSGVVSKSSGEKASVLPYECIMQDDFGTEYVYKLNKNRAVRANIITGREFENSAEIISGISDEDIIVTNPSDIKKAKAYIKVKSDGGKEND
ncbi:MAG: efflux RND transporter periplasmic adaptor subunit, partial [Oscillospiraceae bacterium]